MSDIVDPSLALVRDLRGAAMNIGLSCLSMLLHPEPAWRQEVELECDPSMLSEFVEIVKRLVETEDPEYDDVTDLPSEDATATEGERDYIYSTQLEDYTPSDQRAEPAAEHTVEISEEKTSQPAINPRERGASQTPPVSYTIASTIYDELYPTAVIVPKKQLARSFPGIDAFDEDITLLGHGAFGLTFKSSLKGVPVVLKVSKIKSEEANRSDYHEWSVSDRLREHPNVLQVAGLCPSFTHPDFRSAGTTAIISPLQENGSLGEFLKNAWRPWRQDEDQMANVAFGMIQGIRSLHEQGVIHRDIALRNFLVDKDGRVMLCDFGLARFLPDGKSRLEPTNEKELLPWRWMAPESHGAVFSKESDIWMYGLALFEVATNKRPWDSYRSASELNKFLKSEGFEVPALSGVPSVVADLIRDCCVVDPSNRPTADAIAERLVRWRFRSADKWRDRDRDTQLIRYARLGNRQSVSTILQQREPAMVNAINKFGEVALAVANDTEIKQMLLAYRNIPSSNKEPSRNVEYSHNTDAALALFKLMECGDNASVKALIHVGTDAILDDLKKASYNGQTPLHWAAQFANDDVATYMLSISMFDINKADDAGETALHVAARYGHNVVLRTLLAHGTIATHGEPNIGYGENARISKADVNSQDFNGESPLHKAVMAGSLASIESLLACSDVNVNLADKTGQSPAFKLISGGKSDQEIVAALKRFLSQTLFDGRICDKTGETLLHKAVRQNFKSATQLLLKHKDVNPNATDKALCWTPLHLAVYERSLEAAEILLEHAGVDINAVDNEGSTCLAILTDDVKNLRSDEALDLQVLNLLLSQDALKINSLGQEPLVIASKRGRLQFVKRLLESVKIDKIHRKTILRKALEYAACYGHLDVVKFFLEITDIDINACDEYGITALLIASQRGHSGIVRQLLAHRSININAKSPKCGTALCQAASKGHLDIVQLLLQNTDIDVNVCDGNGYAALHWASEKGHLEVVSQLLAHHAIDINANSPKFGTALHRAALNGHLDIVQLMLQNTDIDVNVCDEEGYTALHWASENGHLEITRQLLALPTIEINAKSPKLGTPLHRAALNGHLDIVKILQQNTDIDVNASDEDGLTALHWATEGGHCEIARQLLAHPAIDINANSTKDGTALHRAAFNGHLDIVQHLLQDADIDVNACIEKGSTALHWASQKGHLEVVRQFLAHPTIDINAKSPKFGTALHRAARNGHLDIVQLLLQNTDIDVNVGNEDGFTALQWASQHGHLEVVRQLLAHHAINININSPTYGTALHRAASYGHPDIVKLLSTHTDIDVSICDVNGRTALDWATLKGHIDIVEFLSDRDGTFHS